MTSSSPKRAVKRSPYIPDRGDVVWIDFDPQAGHEQAGRRPAPVISPKDYNERVGLAICGRGRSVRIATTIRPQHPHGNQSPETA